MWPPSLEDLKTDLRVDDSELDDQYQVVLDAAVSFVEKVRNGDFNFTGEVLSELPDPSSDLQLGTLRLAGRWHERRNTPQMLLTGGDFTSSRVPSIDPDIERLLGIGRYRGPVFA